MKKTLTTTALMCLAVLAISCGNKKGKDAPIAFESYSDSVYMVNDSTIGDLQTYIYEGMLPTDAGILEYLRGRVFMVEQVDFAEKYFEVKDLNF